MVSLSSFKYNIQQLNLERDKIHLTFRLTWVLRFYFDPWLKQWTKWIFKIFWLHFYINTILLIFGLNLSSCELKSITIHYLIAIMTWKFPLNYSWVVKNWKRKKRQCMYNSLWIISEIHFDATFRDCCEVCIPGQAKYLCQQLFVPSY